MSGLDLEGMDEIVQEFLVESTENLDQLDRDLVTLESEPGSRDLLSSIFRTIHTIKGTSGFLAFSKLEAVTHVGENLLSKLRDGVLVVNPQTTDALLLMVDVVRQILATIEATGGEGSTDIDAAVAAVEACLTPAAARVPRQGAAVVPAPVSPADRRTTDVKVDGLFDNPVKTTARASLDPLPETYTRAAVPDAAPSPNASATPAAPGARKALLLGEVLIAAGVTTAEAVAAAVQQQLNGDSRRLGEILVARGDADERAVEECLETQRKRSVSDSSIRVDVDLLDLLMRQVGELVLARNQLQRYATDTRDAELSAMAQRLNLITTELQEGVMKTRMQPIDHVWSKLPRIVRDLSAQMGKKVGLVMLGKETELDKTLLEAIKDPLTHIVRNCLDHGIEEPATRLALGKPESGTLRMAAFHENGRIVIEIADDGAGIDPARIGAKAVERGIVTASQLASMSNRDICMMIFLPGFSTAAQVTNVSGRGVGMDVVRTNVERIGGTVDLDSVVGRGATLRLTIPLTLAIIPALTIECRGQRFAVPQVSVLELLTVGTDRSPATIESIAGAAVYRLRGALLPIVDLAEVLRIDGEARTGPVTIAVLQSEDRRFGLVIGGVLSSEEIVVKALGPRLKGISSFSGATILGDGHVALILDIASLAVSVMRAPLAAVEERLGADSRDVERVLVASVGDGRRVAIPLDTVTRLEEIDTSLIERVGSREVVAYHGEIVPLVRLSRHLGATESGAARLPVVVATRGGRSAALMVERILDIVEGDVSSRSLLGATGLLGSAIIDGQVTEMLDVREAILAADPEFFATPGGWTDGPSPFDTVTGVLA